MKTTNTKALAKLAAERLKQKNIFISEKNAIIIASLLADEIAEQLVVKKQVEFNNFIKLKLHHYSERKFWSNGEWKKTRAYFALKITLNHKLKGYLKSKVKK